MLDRIIDRSTFIFTKQIFVIFDVVYDPTRRRNFQGSDRFNRTEVREHRRANSVSTEVGRCIFINLGRRKFPGRYVLFEASTVRHNTRAFFNGGI